MSETLWTDRRVGDGMMGHKVKRDTLDTQGPETLFSGFISQGWLKLPTHHPGPEAGATCKVVAFGYRECPCCGFSMAHLHVVTPNGVMHGCVECEHTGAFYVYEVPEGYTLRSARE